MQLQRLVRNCAISTLTEKVLVHEYLTLLFASILALSPFVLPGATLKRS